MCKDLWRFSLEWGNGNKYGKNNQRGAFEVGKTDSGKAVLYKYDKWTGQTYWTTTRGEVWTLLP